MTNQEKIQRLVSYLAEFREVQEAMQRSLVRYLATGNREGFSEFEEDIRKFMDSEFPIPEDAEVEP